MNSPTPHKYLKNVIEITLHTGTNQRHFSLLKGDEEDDSIITAKSVDTLMEQIETLMVDASRFEVRAQFLHHMQDQQMFTPWATTAQPYPPFIQTNP